MFLTIPYETIKLEHQERLDEAALRRLVRAAEREEILASQSSLRNRRWKIEKIFNRHIRGRSVPRLAT